MKQMAEGFDKNLQEIVDSEDSPNIISITHNDDFTDFKVEYAADELSFVDSFTVITFYYMGGFYGIFNGKTPDNIHVSFVNSKTGKVIQEANSKDIATESSNTDT